MNRIAFPSSLKWITFFLFIALGILTVLRLALLIQNYSYFSVLSLSQIILAFAHGLRFDLSILGIFCGIPLLFLSFPVFAKSYRLVFGGLAILLLQPVIILTISDLLFFKESSFHIGNQLLLIADDLPFLWEMIGEYWVYLALYILLITATAYLLVLSCRSIQRYPRWQSLPVFLIVCGILFFGINGKIGIKIDRMISTSDAFSGGTIPFGNLVLNGAFSSFQVVKEKRWKNKTRFFSSDEAIHKAKEALVYPGLESVSSEYPLSFIQHKHYAPKLPSNSNILIIMLESWSAKYIDSFASSDAKKWGVTPFFDQLAAQGIRFTNFYPNGSMSLYGASSILTSLPPMPRLPALGKGIEVYNLFRPADLFSRKNYQTFAAQSAIRVSFRLDTIAKYLGFSDYFGKEDYPRLYALESPTNGWDGETFSFLKGHLEKSSKPFFGFIFSGTTHIPYYVPDSKFEKFDPSPKGETGFLNTLFYADAMLGEFMKWSETQEWFENTLFVFVADHTLNRSVVGEEAKIPLLFYSPKWLKSREVKTLGSQVDIMPSILDLIGSSEPYAGIGRSLFSPGDKMVINETSRRMGIIAPSGEYLQHDLKQLVNSTFKDQVMRDHYSEVLLAIEQSFLETIESNSLYRSDYSLKSK